MRYQLTTKEKIKDRLVLNDDWDNALDDIIYGVTGLITSLLGKELAETTYTYATENGRVFLPVTPVSSIDTYEDWDGNQFVTRDAGDVPRFNKVSGEVDSYAPAGFQTTQITYTAGYKIDFPNEINVTLHTLPAELSELATRMAIRQYRKIEHEGEGSTSFDTSTTSWQDLVRPEDYDIINRHRATWI